ncbi:hypothetical protein QEM02_000517 [Pseudomonas putida]|nr:hypothetical protein [Pseudomonas putida]
MSGGVTSYPRTGGGGGSTVQQINQLIAHLNAALGAQSLQVQGDQLIVLLQQFVQSAATSQSIVTLARRVRDALFIARCNGNLPIAKHLEAMVICSDAWRTAFPLAATALGPRAAKAESDLAQYKANGGNTQQLRAIKEEMGVIAWQYEASALLGEDLSAGVAGQANQLGTSKYIGARDAKGRLSYLECAGPYNVNVLLCIDVPGARKPMVLVGEAKGGKSAYGKVERTPAFVSFTQLRGGRISQTDLLYAPSRALYMVNACAAGAAPSGRPELEARRDAGDMILQAFNALNLCYMTARGDAAVGSPVSAKRGYLACQ